VSSFFATLTPAHAGFFDEINIQRFKFMNEVLDQNQIDSADTEINVAALIDSYERNSDADANHNEEESIEPLSPALSESDTDKAAEFSLEDIITSYIVAEVDDRYDLQTTEGQSIGNLILPEDQVGFYSALDDALQTGRGVWSAEGETHIYLTVFFKNLDGVIECHKYSKKIELEEEEDKLKRSEVEELSEEPKAESGSLELPEDGYNAELTSPGVEVASATPQYASVDTFMEAIFRSHEFEDESYLESQIQNSDVTISVDNSNVKTVETVTGEPEIQNIDVVADAAPITEAASIEADATAQQTDDETPATVRAPAISETSLTYDIPELVFPVIADLGAVELSVLVEDGRIEEDEPVIVVPENVEIPAIAALDFVEAKPNEQQTSVPPLLIEQLPVADSEIVREIRFVSEVTTPAVDILESVNEQLLLVDGIEQLAILEDIAIPESLSVSEDLSIIEETAEDRAIPDIKAFEVIEEFEELPGIVQVAIDIKEPAIEIERANLFESTKAIKNYEGPARAELRPAEVSLNEPVIESADTKPEQIVLTPASAFEILNTSSLIETGIGIHTEKVAEHVAEITDVKIETLVKIEVADKTTVGDEIAMLADPVEKAVEQQEQPRIFTEDVEDIRPSAAITAASKSSNELQSQIYAETGIRLVRNNPSYIYEVARPRRGANAAQDITKIDNDTQQNQPAVQLAKAA
jgi:hypothetical protein